MSIVLHEKLSEFLSVDGMKNYELMTEMESCNDLYVEKKREHDEERIALFVQEGTIKYPNQQLWKVLDDDAPGWILFTFCPDKIIALVKAEIKKKENKKKKETLEQGIRRIASNKPVNNIGQVWNIETHNWIEYIEN